MEERPLKRVVIKEEFVALTGDFVKAAILAQFEYWQARVRDFDKFITEEKARAEAEGNPVTIEETHGWIYKSAEELAEETMIGLAPSNMRKHMKALIEAGYLLERKNPNHKWDRTLQYRLDLGKIRAGLQDLGYELEGWKRAESPVNVEGDETKTRNHETKTQRERNERAIPEITNRDSSTTNAQEESNESDNVTPLNDTVSRCLHTLSKVGGFPRDQAENARYIAELREESPDVDAAEVCRQYEIWHRDNPGKTKNYRSRLRNFFRRAQETGKFCHPAGSSGGPQSGVRAPRSVTPTAGVEALRNYVHPKGGPNDLRSYAAVAETRWDFTRDEAPPWQVMKDLGNDHTILQRIRSVVKRAVREEEAV